VMRWSKPGRYHSAVRVNSWISIFEMVFSRNHCQALGILSVNA
jgi:hypothetical protein